VKRAEFLDHLKASGLRIERVTEVDEDNAVALVRSHADKTYSLCDALAFIVCERLGSTDAIACDDDFRSYGRLTILL
jgi:predicted nucleic acid-binding protein